MERYDSELRWFHGLGFEAANPTPVDRRRRRRFERLIHSRPVDPPRDVGSACPQRQRSLADGARSHPLRRSSIRRAADEIDHKSTPEPVCVGRSSIGIDVQPPKRPVPRQGPPGRPKGSKAASGGAEYRKPTFPAAPRGIQAPFRSIDHDCGHRLDLRFDPREPCGGTSHACGAPDGPGVRVIEIRLWRRPAAR